VLHRPRVTAAETHELLDAVDRLERLTDPEVLPGTARPRHDALLVALADLVARTVRVWVMTASRP
jgi:hypothetical protein